MNVWKVEQDRQADELSMLIQGAIDDFGKRCLEHGRQPMLNAVASALISVEGAMLASVTDRRIRKELRRVMDRGLVQAIAAYEGKSGSVPLIFADRRADA
jgi:hypothetical protein